MAPEENTQGATIDQRTTVFTRGRLVTHFGTRLSEDLAHFVGSGPCADAVRRACRPEPGDRFSTVADVATGWLDGR